MEYVTIYNKSVSPTLRFLARSAFILILLLLTVGSADAKQKRKLSHMSEDQIRDAQQRLVDLGYWLGTVDGKIGNSTRFALVAFQKVEGRTRTGILTDDEVAALRDAKRPEPRETGYAHIEIDLARQVLFIVDDTGKVSGILPVSTGSGRAYSEHGQRGIARTPRGKFTVYKKISGWRRAPLGLLYYPSYFERGYAIHGNPSVPMYAASHGCVRIPMFAAEEFSKQVPVGTTVLIYDDSQ